MGSDPGEPIFHLVGPTPCDPVTAFQTHSFTYDASSDDVTQITATFTQHCEEDPTMRLTGCVHYTQ
jgi:hypothetical protein